MAFDSLSDKLQKAFRKLTGKGKLNEANIKDAMREVRLALLEADVNYLVVKDFIKAVTERAVGAEIKENYAVVCADAPALAGNAGQHKFVHYALGVAIGHNLGRRAFIALAIYHCGIRFFHAVPAVVAVHAVVSPADGADIC